MKVTEKEAQEFCAECSEICSRHCVIWRKAKIRENEKNSINDGDGAYISNTCVGNAEIKRNVSWNMTNKGKD